MSVSTCAYLCERTCARMFVLTSMRSNAHASALRARACEGEGVGEDRVSLWAVARACARVCVRVCARMQLDGTEYSEQTPSHPSHPSQPSDPSDPSHPDQAPCRRRRVGARFAVARSAFLARRNDLCVPRAGERMRRKGGGPGLRPGPDFSTGELRRRTKPGRPSYPGPYATWARGVARAT